MINTIKRKQPICISSCFSRKWCASSCWFFFEVHIV